VAPVRKVTCLKCHRVQPHAGRGLCAACKAEAQAIRDRARIGQRERGHYLGDWPTIRATAIREHMQLHGLTATCGHTVETKRDLTVDHIKARSLEQGVRVICRSCNSSKGNR
jgi:5-methylcytosine-specific restriction endonuclease McrA